MKMIEKQCKALRHWWQRNMMHVLVVPEWQGRHIAKNTEDYWGWVECYPQGTKMLHYTPRWPAVAALIYGK